MRLSSDGIKAMSRGFPINPEARAKMAGIVNKVYFFYFARDFARNFKGNGRRNCPCYFKKQVNNIFPWTVLLSNIAMMSKCLKICNETTPSLLVVSFEFRIF